MAARQLAGRFTSKIDARQTRRGNHRRLAPAPVPRPASQSPSDKTVLPLLMMPYRRWGGQGATDRLPMRGASRPGRSRLNALQTAPSAIPNERLQTVRDRAKGESRGIRPHCWAFSKICTYTLVWNIFEIGCHKRRQAPSAKQSGAFDRRRQFLVNSGSSPLPLWRSGEKPGPSRIPPCRAQCGAVKARDQTSRGRRGHRGRDPGVFARQPAGAAGSELKGAVSSSPWRFPA